MNLFKCFNQCTSSTTKLRYCLTLQVQHCVQRTPSPPPPEKAPFDQGVLSDKTMHDSEGQEIVLLVNFSKAISHGHAIVENACPQHIPTGHLSFSGFHYTYTHKIVPHTSTFLQHTSNPSLKSMRVYPQYA